MNPDTALVPTNGEVLPATQPTMIPDPFALLPDRFWDKVLFEPNTGCWLWMGGLTRRGKYARFKVQGQTKCGHVVAYTTLIGPVPEKLVLDHLCRITRCVNPSHLEPVTCAENIRRGRLPQREKTHCPQGHPYDDANTHYWKRDNSRHCRTCDRLRHRRTWQRKREIAA